MSRSLYHIQKSVLLLGSSLSGGAIEIDGPWAAASVFRRFTFLFCFFSIVAYIGNIFIVMQKECIFHIFIYLQCVYITGYGTKKNQNGF